MFIRMLLIFAALAYPLKAAPWGIIDPDTRVEVGVPWLGNVVRMRFDDVSGAIDFDARRPDRARADILVDVTTVETGLGIVNAFVKGPDYLNARAFPQIRFQLDRLEQTTKSTADIYGRITFLGITRPVLFKATAFRYGPNDDQSGRFEAGFDLSGEIDRRSYGHTTGLPEIAAVLPVRIRLLMTPEE